MKKLCAMYSLLLCLGSAGFMHGAEQRFFDAIKDNSPELVINLLEQERVNPNIIQDGQSALHFAIANNRTALIPILLAHGARVDSPMILAALWQADDALLRMLLMAPTTTEQTINEAAELIRRTEEQVRGTIEFAGLEHFNKIRQEARAQRAQTAGEIKQLREARILPLDLENIVGDYLQD